MGAAYSGAVGLEGVNALAELTAIPKNGAMVADTVFGWIKGHNTATAWTVGSFTIAGVVAAIGTNIYNAVRKTEPVLVSHVDHTGTMELITTAHKSTLSTPQTQILPDISTSSEDKLSTMNIASTSSVLATSRMTISIATTTGPTTPAQTTQSAPVSISSYIQASETRSIRSTIFQAPHITTKSSVTTTQATQYSSVRSLSTAAGRTEISTPETKTP